MTTIAEIRQQYPQYGDLSDAELAFGFHQNFYSDIPIIEFTKQLNMDTSQALDVLRFANTQGVRGMHAVETTAPTVGGDVMGAVRSGFQGLTFGAGDELVAGGIGFARQLAGDERAFPEIYSEELQRERERIGEFREDRPGLALASEVLGGAAVPLGVTRTLPRAIGVGGATGAATGFLSAEGGLENRMTQAGISALTGSVLGGALRGVADLAGSRWERYLQNRAIRELAKDAPQLDQLREEARAGYQFLRDSGVQISPEAYDEFVSRILRSDIMQPLQGSMADVGRDVMPDIARVLTRMTSARGKAIDVSDLNTLRTMAQVPAGMFQNPMQQTAAMQIINGIDELMSNLNESQVVSGIGSARAAADAVNRARELWGRMRRSETLREIIETAEAGGYAGGLESGIRTQVGRILRNPKLRNKFNAEELALLSDIQRGSPIGRIVDGISRLGLSTSGGRTGPSAGSMIAGTVAGSTFGPVGALAGAGIELAGATGLRAVREMQLADRARLYSDIIAAGMADQIARDAPEVFNLLRSAAQRGTQGLLQMQ